jgi:hypothetical protein
MGRGTTTTSWGGRDAAELVDVLVHHQAETEAGQEVAVAQQQGQQDNQLANTRCCGATTVAM